MYIGPGLPEDYERASFANTKGGDHLPSREVHVLKGHEGPVFAVRFNKAGTYCMTCGRVSQGMGLYGWVPCMVSIVGRVFRKPIIVVTKIDVPLTILRGMILTSHTPGSEYCPLEPAHWSQDQDLCGPWLRCERCDDRSGQRQVCFMWRR